MAAEHHCCVICLSSPPHEPATVKGCSCGHEFCLACLEQWCRTRRQPKCPLCQHAIEQIVCGSSEQDVPPPDRVEEEGPDLRCLDHSFFSAESDRLLCRARAAQMHLVRSAYGCGRSGSSAADDASDTLQQVIDTLAGYKDDMQREVPFEPEAVLHALYSLEQIVSSIAAGSWAGGGGGDTQLPARFSADNAAAGLQGWQEHSDSEEWSEDDDGLDSSTRKRLERTSFSSTPGRRPTPSGGGSARRRSGAGGSSGGGGLAARDSSGNLSARGSSGSLSAGGSARRR